MWILCIFTLRPSLSFRSSIHIRFARKLRATIGSRAITTLYLSLSFSISLSRSPGGPSARVPFNTHVWIAMRNRTEPREFTMHARDSFKRVTNGMHLPDEIAVPNSGREFLRTDGTGHSHASQSAIVFAQKRSKSVKIVASNLIS